MQIAIVGTGYVGLVSGVCFADLGFHVTCVDKDANKITALQKGAVPIYEPGLDALIEKNVAAGRITFTTSLSEAAGAADIILIAVGTPPHKTTGKADLSYVFAAAEEIAHNVTGYKVIVTKSTVPVGTGKKIKSIISKANPKAQFDVASNPEFLREGSAISDFMNPDRIVVGVESDAAGRKLAELYKPLTDKGFPLLRTEIETSEMIKYASNSFLATKIAFINEMADICEAVGANVEMVAKGMGMDTRIGDKFLKPGPGYGGSCFPKDVLALVQLADEYGLEPGIIHNVMNENSERRERMADRVVTACGGSVKGKRVAVLGLTFKANTDDMRESPSLYVIPRLLDMGAQVATFDPEGTANAKTMLNGPIEWCDSIADATKQADATVVVTEWDAFRMMDLEALRNTMKTPIVVDLRNLFNPQEMARIGFDYHSIGRAAALGYSSKSTTDDTRLQAVAI